MIRRLRPRTRWLLGGACVGAVLFGPGMVELGRMSLEQRRLDRQLAALSVRQEQLTTEQKRLETDEAYVEGLIRSTFKLAQPGEIVIPLESHAQPSFRDD